MGERFVRAQDFVSGEALHKEVLREPGFLALQGGFGRKLKRMSNPTDTSMQLLRTVMTNVRLNRLGRGLRPPRCRVCQPERPTGNRWTLNYRHQQRGSRPTDLKL